MTTTNNEDQPSFDGDADEVGRELLAWAGLLDLWDETGWVTITTLSSTWVEAARAWRSTTASRVTIGP